MQWLMCDRPDGTAPFVGLARVQAASTAAPGTFGLENTGEFDGMVARGPWSVVAEEAPYTLEYTVGSGGAEASSPPAGH